jgi:PEP-CTERM motif
MRNISRACGLILLGLLTAAVLVPSTASATPVGLMNTASGAGGVTISLTSFVWFTHPNSFVVGGGTTLTSAVGNPAIGSTGDFKDLNITSPLPVSEFITFNTLPGLVFDLSSLGPGSANTNCAGLSIGQSCSVFAGSPFILTIVPTGTLFSLTEFGIARDGTLPNSNWQGIITTQFVNQTPAQIQNLFGCHTGSVGPGDCTNQSATLTSSDSGSFLATAGTSVPEPATMALLGTGLVSLLVIRRKIAKK